MKYLNVQEIESALINLTSAYPNLCELITLPLRTHEGRTCHALRIGKKPKNECDNILIIGGVHAREWGSCEICVSFAADLLEAYVTNTGLKYGNKIFNNTQIRNVIESLNVIIFPDVNPDGRNWSFTNINNAERWWRKNRNPIAGVDINRNFDFLWDFPNLFSPSSRVFFYTSTDPTNLTYHGPSAFSEPETRNVRWLIDEFPRIRWFMDLHSFSELVLHNWGDDENQNFDTSMDFKNNSFNSVRGIKGDTLYRDFLPSCEWTGLVSRANQMENSINSVRGKNYSVEQSFDLYPTSGTSMDYAFSRYFTNPSKGKIFAFTIEWGTEFQPLWGEMKNIILDISSALLTFCLEAKSKSAVDERWTFGTSLNVENPTVGQFKHTTLYTSIILAPGQHNFVMTSVPSPNVVEGWKIKSVMLRYRITAGAGVIDKIGIRDGNESIHSFENLLIGVNNAWETLKLELPCPKSFKFGLDVSIHVFYDPGFGGPQPPPTPFQFASIGLEFTKDT
jgi:murein tripeptide amidase MpaA